MWIKFLNFLAGLLAFIVDITCFNYAKGIEAGGKAINKAEAKWSAAYTKAGKEYRATVTKASKKRSGKLAKAKAKVESKAANLSDAEKLLGKLKG